MTSQSQYLRNIIPGKTFTYQASMWRGKTCIFIRPSNFNFQVNDARVDGYLTSLYEPRPFSELGSAESEALTEAKETRGNISLKVVLTPALAAVVRAWDEYNASFINESDVKDFGLKGKRKPDYHPMLYTANEKEAMSLKIITDGANATDIVVYTRNEDGSLSEGVSGSYLDIKHGCELLLCAKTGGMWIKAGKVGMAPVITSLIVINKTATEVEIGRHVTMELPDELQQATIKKEDCTTEANPQENQKVL